MVSGSLKDKYKVKTIEECVSQTDTTHLFIHRCGWLCMWVSLSVQTIHYDFYWSSQFCFTSFAFIRAGKGCLSCAVCVRVSAIKCAIKLSDDNCCRWCFSCHHRRRRYNCSHSYKPKWPLSNVPASCTYLRINWISHKIFEQVECKANHCRPALDPIHIDLANFSA